MDTYLAKISAFLSGLEVNSVLLQAPLGYEHVLTEIEKKLSSTHPGTLFAVSGSTDCCPDEMGALHLDKPALVLLGSQCPSLDRCEAKPALPTLHVPVNAPQHLQFVKDVVRKYPSATFLPDIDLHSLFEDVIGPSQTLLDPNRLMKEFDRKDPLGQLVVVGTGDEQWRGDFKTLPLHAQALLASSAFRTRISALIMVNGDMDKAVTHADPDDVVINALVPLLRARFVRCSVAQNGQSSVILVGEPRSLPVAVRMQKAVRDRLGITCGLLYLGSRPTDDKIANLGNVDFGVYAHSCPAHGLPWRGALRACSEPDLPLLWVYELGIIAGDFQFCYDWEPTCQMTIKDS